MTLSSHSGRVHGKLRCARCSAYADGASLSAAVSRDQSLSFKQHIFSTRALSCAVGCPLLLSLAPILPFYNHSPFISSCEAIDVVEDST